MYILKLGQKCILTSESKEKLQNAQKEITEDFTKWDFEYGTYLESYCELPEPETPYWVNKLPGVVWGLSKFEISEVEHL